MKRQKEERKYHKPVLVDEVLKTFCKAKKALLKNHDDNRIDFRVIDATLGFAGHTKELIKCGFKVLGIEADSETLKIAEQVLKKEIREFKNGDKACPGSYSMVASSSPVDLSSYRLVNGNFRNIDTIAQENGFDEADGILYDLGVSTAQLTSQDRGFSFQNLNAPLDMRIDRQVQKVTASDLLNALDETNLTKLFAEVLSFGVSRKIARAVAVKRKNNKIETTGELLEALRFLENRKKKAHFATLPFLALRISVNSELKNLAESLPKAFELLKPEGILVVISFHSGEDRIVKKFMNDLSDRGEAKKVTKTPIVPGEEEVGSNPSARSAKMRVLIKL